MDVINMNIRMALLEDGFTNIEIKTIFIAGMDNRLDDRSGQTKIKSLWYRTAQYKATGLHDGCVPGRRSDSMPALQFIQYLHSSAALVLQPAKLCINVMIAREPFDYFKCH
jgi:ring-1,2-phenylacetyl-CoA epoxidase subunit PaaD